MNISAWRYYLNFYRSSWKRLLIAIFISLFESILTLPVALLVRHIFDEVIPNKDIRSLIIIGISIILLQVLNSGVILYVRYTILDITKSVIKSLRSKILEFFYAIPYSSFTKVDRSRLHTIVVQDTERLDVMSNALVAIFLPSLAVSITLSMILLYLNWVLFLVLFSLAPLLFIISRLIGRKVRARIFAFQRKFEVFSQGMLFVLQHMELTRSHSAMDTEINRQEVSFDKLRDTSLRMAWLATAYRNLQDGIVSVSIVLILIIGGGAVVMGWMSLGEILSFYVVIGLIRKHLHAITSSVPQIIEGNESLTSLYNLIKSKGSRPYKGSNMIDFQGKIKFEQISFGYGDQLVLKDVNLSIPAKGITGIVGPNGAGKSSVISLILGLYAPDKGNIYAEGIPFREIDIIQLRKSMAIVQQDPILFPGTVLENITYGNSDKLFGDVVEAANLATAHEFIVKLSDGYQTQIGEKGLKLSGGERQRIAIARAFLRDPALLLLDEPTNNLDGSVLIKLMEKIKTWSHNKAVLIVSHNTEVIRRTQIVYKLEHGHITFSGPTEEYFQMGIQPTSLASVN
ncbi:MAG: ABC transporter ATP-binding protein [Anaerolineae bacterium]|nr:ABC transporter ATP-binding protein [Anaerolineae bacterium]